MCFRSVLGEGGRLPTVTVCALGASLDCEGVSRAPSASRCARRLPHLRLPSCGLVFICSFSPLPAQLAMSLPLGLPPQTPDTRLWKEESLYLKLVFARPLHIGVNRHQGHFCPKERRGKNRPLTTGKDGGMCLNEKDHSPSCDLRGRSASQTCC